MSDGERNEVSCIDCGVVPRLYETPYADTDYVVGCDCEQHAIDVSDVLNDNALVHPLSGKWSNVDHDHKIA